MRIEHEQQMFKQRLARMAAARRKRRQWQSDRWTLIALILLLAHSSTGQLEAQQQQQQQPLQNTGTAQQAQVSSLQRQPNYLETGRQITGILDRFMSLGYDKRVRPNYGGPPVEVNVTMRILSISSVSEVMMDFTADFYFRQTWHDPRLSFKKLGDIQTLYVGAEVSKKIWLPDTFFGNEKMAYFHEATTPNVFLRIDHSGEVYRSIRLTVTSSCPMNLQYFPMDRQRCTIEAESYGYNVKDIIYRWARKDTAVERDTKISLPQFDIVHTVQKYRLEELSSGTYSRLIAEIHFARRMGYYLIQIYIPSSLIVVISWVSFWLHRNASPARVQLGVTTVLTMTTLMSSTNAALPKISYVKSIDIFLGTCFVMVFAALLEYATVGYLGKRIAMRKLHAQHAQHQAQAKLYAQLQAQGAQGEPVPLVVPMSLSPIVAGAGGGGSSPGGGQASCNLGLSTFNTTGPSGAHNDLSGQLSAGANLPPLAALLAGQSALQTPGCFPQAPACSQVSPACSAAIEAGQSHNAGHHDQARQLEQSSAQCLCAAAAASAQSNRQLAPSQCHHNDHHHHHHHHQHHHSHDHPKNQHQLNDNDHHDDDRNNDNNHHDQHHKCGSCPANCSRHRRQETGPQCQCHPQFEKQHIGPACCCGHLELRAPTPPKRKQQQLLQQCQCRSKVKQTGSQTLPRNHAAQAAVESHQGQSVCCSNTKQPPSYDTNNQRLVWPETNTMDATRLQGPPPPPSMRMSGTAAAAAAAAATFVNMHRKNKGLPPSTNPNFAPFNLQLGDAATYNYHLETIFGIRPSDIDKYSRVVFPVCFVCFQLMYWIVYLHISAFLEPDSQGQQQPPTLPIANSTQQPVI